MMLQNNRNQAGFSLFIVLGSLIFLALIIGTSLLINHPKTPVSVISPVTSASVTITNPSAFLMIKEWGIKLPTGVNSLSAAEYQSPVTLADGTAMLKLGDHSLDKLYCIMGSSPKSSAKYPGTLYRSTSADILSQHSLYDASSFVHLDNYYYAFQHSPSPGDCSRLTAEQRQTITNVAAAYQALWPKLITL